MKMIVKQLRILFLLRRIMYKVIDSNIPIVIACGIVLHHYKKHYNDPKLTLLEKFVQFSDIDNHASCALFF